MRQQEERAITSLHGEPPRLELDPPAAGRLSGNCILHRPFPSADSPGGTKEPQRTMGVRRRVDMRWQGALALTAAVAVGEGRAALAADTQRVIAGRPQYDRSGYFKWHFGEGYRKLWTAPFEAPVLDLKTYAGGLTPVRRSAPCRASASPSRAPDGKAYTFRTLDKDPTKILPEAWRHSFPATIFQDQTAASHPGGAFMIPPMAEAAGVPHTSPVIVVMPDDPALGEFRETFGGKTGSIDEFPTPAAGPTRASRGRPRSSPPRSCGRGGRRARSRSTRGRCCARASSTSSSATGTATTASGAG
jgi:hypothetical protein